MFLRRVIHLTMVVLAGVAPHDAEGQVAEKRNAPASFLLKARRFFYIRQIMETTVPIIIDDVIGPEGVDMVRCIYFQIEGEGSLSPWQLGLGPFRIPFLMVGLAGIITHPMDGSPEFGDPQQVKALLDFVEQPNDDHIHNNELVVEVADLWLPNNLLQKRGSKPTRGNVFRVGYKLFQLAYSFRNGQKELKELQEQTNSLSEQVEFSEKETYAFSLWAKREVALAREYRDPDLWLNRKGKTNE